MHFHLFSRMTMIRRKIPLSVSSHCFFHAWLVSVSSPARHQTRCSSCSNGAPFSFRLPMSRY